LAVFFCLYGTVPTPAGTDQLAHLRMARDHLMLFAFTRIRAAPDAAPILAALDPLVYPDTVHRRSAEGIARGIASDAG
jgi:hypothetical protein